MTKTVSSTVIHLTAPLCPPDAERSDSNQHQSVSGEEQSEDLGSSSQAVGPGAIDGTPSNLKSVAASATKLIIRGVNESADAFGPLKSVAGFLTFITFAFLRKKDDNRPAIENARPWKSPTRS